MASYLYNGVELPALPEWDKTVYPYAVIMRAKDYEQYPSAFEGEYYLICSVSKFVFTHPSFNQYGGIDVDKGTALMSLYTPTEGDINWQSPQMVTWDKGFTEDIVDYVWCNPEISREDGTIYLAASDPIPVNPAPALDPTSLLMGWQVGNRIRQSK